VTCKSIGKIYVMVRIKTIDFPDGGGRGRIGLMDSNLYVLEKLAATMADRNPRHGPSPRPAGARPAAPTSVRQRIGATMIGLGAWLRDAGAVVPVRSAVR
jgi:hypothetical protein